MIENDNNTTIEDSLINFVKCLTWILSQTSFNYFSIYFISNLIHDRFNDFLLGFIVFYVTINNLRYLA